MMYLSCTMYIYIYANLVILLLWQFDLYDDSYMLKMGIKIKVACQPYIDVRFNFL